MHRREKNDLQTKIEPQRQRSEALRCTAEKKSLKRKLIIETCTVKNKRSKKPQGFYVKLVHPKWQ